MYFEGELEVTIQHPQVYLKIKSDKSIGYVKYDSETLRCIDGKYYLVDYDGITRHGEVVEQKKINSNIELPYLGYTNRLNTTFHIIKFNKDANYGMIIYHNKHYWIPLTPKKIYKYFKFKHLRKTR
jgi:hypothetical protein